jgi:hypothetical protein
MKDALTQLDIRENTASSRRHASRPAVDSPRSIFTKPLARRLQDRLQTPLLASGTGDTDSLVNNTPPEVATGEENKPSAETLPGRTAVTAEGSRQVAETPEPFVSAGEAAQFLSVNRRYLLELSRGGIAGAYALGTGRKRKIWVFRLSELAASIVRNETSISKPQKPCTIGSGSPR